MYTCGPGSDANAGTNACFPKLTITNLLASYTLGPGDVVFIDTGSYTNYTVTLTSTGLGGNPIVIRGSTNYAAGGTIIDRRNSSANPITLLSARNLVISDLTVKGGQNGIGAVSITNVLFERVIAQNNSSGFFFNFSSANTLRRCVAINNTVGLDIANTGPFYWDYGVSWSNGTAFNAGGTLYISNSVVVGGTVYGSTVPRGIEYTIFWNVTFPGGIDYISDFITATTNAGFLASVDPHLTNALSLDFHPQSVVGRYNPLTGGRETDTVHSALIDFGDPTRTYTNELPPSGTAPNIGIFGDHYEASYSRTNPWFFAFSYNDGGTLVSTGTLRWTYGAFTNGATVRLQYSSNGGSSWSNIVTGLSVTNRKYIWAATGAVSSLNALWRIQDESLTNVWDACDSNFTLRALSSVTFTSYVNDASTNGDVYCLAAGSVTNDGLSPATPRPDLQSVLDSYDFGPGDLVYVDTGVYTSQVRLVAADRGTTGSLFQIRGSTNLFAGGSVIDRGSLLLDGISIGSGANFLGLQYLTVRNSRYALDQFQSQSCEFWDLRLLSSLSGFRGNTISGNRILRTLASGNSVGIEISGSSGNQVDLSVLWSNTTHSSFSSISAVSISNSIIGGGGAAFGGSAPTNSNYVLFWNVTLGGGFNSLYDYQKTRNTSWQSTYGNPLFAASTNQTFYLSSQVGRYDPTTLTFVTDIVHSAGIDFGDPSRSVGDELAPYNGGRINVGVHGGTARASLSITNAALLALSLQDGGQLSVGDAVYWNAYNLVSGATVRIEYSGDGGFSWNVIATNLSASNGSYSWSNTNFPSSTSARWRVVLESNPTVLSSVGTNFVFRNGPFPYYVNDDSLVGDLYTTAVGNDSNLGSTPAAPKNSLTNLLATVDLEPGDIVYIDTGVYRSSATPQVTAADSGNATNPVVLQFSTNRSAGGAVFDRMASGYGLEFVGGSGYVDVRDSVMTNCLSGIRVLSAPGIHISGSFFSNMRDSGISVIGAASTEVDRCAMFLSASNGLSVSGGSSVFVRRSVFWRNRFSQVRADAGLVSITNSILVTSTSAAPIYFVATLTNIQANYNAVLAESNSSVAAVGTMLENLDTLAAWQFWSGQDRMSLDVDPLFASPDSGDFHLRTQTAEGRFDPALGLWVSDPVTSPLIDAGDPGSVYSNEPSFNGARINIGMHGNTPEASRGRVAPWLLAASMRQGGWVKGTATLHWVRANLATDSLVRVEVSLNGGLSWSMLSTGTVVGAETLAWNTTLTNDTPAALWRVTSLLDTNVFDQTVNFFAVRNAPLSLYLNDGSTINDSYPSALGAATNWVATAAQPLNSLALALRRFDLEPGDRIYVNTGVYTEDGNVDISRIDGGVSNNPVIILGPTNGYFAWHDRQSASVGSVGLNISDVHGLIVSNLVFQGGNVGVHVASSSDLALGIRAIGNASNGFTVVNSTNISLRRMVSANNSGRGLFLATNTAVVVDQAAIWSNALGGILLRRGTLDVSNSVVQAYGSGRYVYEMDTTSEVIRANFNDVLAESSAQVALRAGQTLRFLSNVRATLGQEMQSLAHPPDFADTTDNNFFPLSIAGRFVPGAGIVTDAVSSVLIDTGDPARDASLEPPFNGARINIGPYGQFPWASRSQTNGWLLAVTLNDGGVIRGTNAIYWVAGGVATGHLVTIQFSADGGNTWSNVASNLNASAGSYTSWDTAANGSTLVGLWRVVSQTDSNISDTTDNTFVLNNGALTYYVNDASTNGDVYTTAPGSSANDGALPSSPVSSVSDILSRYILNPGDQILLDTGLYPLNSTLVFDATVAGTATSQIYIVGSTNYGAGGAVLDRQGGDTAVQVRNTTGIVLQNLTIRRARRAIHLDNVVNCSIDSVTIEGGKGFASGVLVYGLEVQDSRTVTVLRTSVGGITNAISAAITTRSSMPVKWLSSISWSNRLAFDVQSGQFAVSNSVVSVFGENASVYQLGEGVSITANYNDYQLVGRATMGRETKAISPTLNGSQSYDTLATWRRIKNIDQRSLSHDPGFANAPSNDFHLLSQRGRFLPSGVVVTDAVSSVLLDAGDSVAAFTNEPAPNGSRINIGRYGNTLQASLTPTNGRLTAISFNDGGLASGTNEVLYWIASGDVTGHLVRVDISYDDGFAWLPLASNLPASVSTARWDTTSWLTQPSVRWRVQSQVDSNIVDQNDRWLQIRNSNMVYYVNDDSTAGDVFSSATGYEFYSGLRSNQPKPYLNDIFDTYDIEPGDTIYVDTGVYFPTGFVGVGYLDSGSASNSVVIQGSTNRAAGGSELQMGVRFDNARSVSIRDLNLIISGTMRDSGISIQSSSNLLVEGVSVRGNPGNAFAVRDSTAITLLRDQSFGAITNGLFDSGSVNTRWMSGLFWSNRTAVRSQALSSGPLVVSNSIVAALSSNQIAFISSGSLIADYNAIWITNGAQVGNLYVAGRELPLQYTSVGRWTGDTGLDQHSLALDPRLSSEGYLLSQAGRYNPATGLFVTNDSETSPLIDAGDPLAVYTNEPIPNGDRINIGPQANTERASRTPTNASLLVVSLRDGGIASADQILYWVARGDATGYTVRIEYSPDKGQTWTNIATNISAQTGSYSWNSSEFPSTVLGLWRVVAEADTNISDISRQPFAVRNGPVPFYVNDGGTNGDVYTFAVGNSTNLGVSPHFPQSTLSGVLDRYDLEPGDIIYVDTGSYTNSSSILFGQDDSGSSTGLLDVVIQGSTNDMAGGSTFIATANSPALEVFDGRYYQFRNLNVNVAAVGGVGFYAQKAIGLSFEQVAVRGGQTSYQILESQNVSWRRCLAHDYLSAGLSAQSSLSLRWDNGVFWSGGTSAVQLAVASFSVSNTAIGAWGTGRYAFRMDANSQLISDYNGIWLDDGALMGYQGVLQPLKYPMIWETVSRWARDTGRDRFSIFGNPLFYDPTNGSFYLRSTAGRFNPTTGTFTNDTDTSPYLDAGSPFSSFSQEPASNNGGRLNIGLHGNTARASRTPTNSALFTVSLNDGGRAEGGSWPLYWLARGNATGHTVRLEYSSNTGVTWFTLATGLPARVITPYFWDTLSYTSTVHSLWRVISETEPGIAATNLRPFALRNQSLSFYVNDTAVTGDVYTSSAGSQTGSGTDPTQPRDSLQALLDNYDLEPGDVVYMDTGQYQLISDQIRWGRFDAWNNMTNLAPLQGGGTSVLLLGSTNAIAGGSSIISITTPTTMILTQALGLAVKNLNIRQVVVGSGVGIEVADSPYVSLQGIQIRNGRDGFYINGSSFVGISNSLAQGHAQAGLHTRLSTDNKWVNGVLWSNTYGALQEDTAGGTLQIQNTAFGAFTTGSFALVKVNGILSSDYNNIFRTNGGFSAGLIQGGALGGGTTRFETVTSWFNSSGNDGRTLAADPKFASSSDFHLQSPAGRYVVGTGYVSNVSDTYSPLIDAGNPGASVGLEPQPNGNRINIGLYGRSSEASLSPSNGLLSTITFNDGGSGQDTINLRWNASGAVTGQFVTLQFSNDGGETWTNIATNVAGNLGSYTWDSVSYGRAAAGLWRIFSQTDTNVTDTLDHFFALRNGGSIPYYVNDGSTVGDVFCSAVGNDSNDGYLPSTPKATLQALLSAVDLEPGDIVYVDTGSYLLSSTLTVGDLDAGTATNRVIIQGSTNLVAGGTVYNRQTGSGTAIELFQTIGIELRDLRVINAGIGVSLREADQCKVTAVRSDQHTTAAFSSELTGTNLFERCIAAFSSNGIIVATGLMQWDGGVVYGNDSPIILDAGGSLQMKNSFVSAVGPSKRIFSVMDGGGTITADYNSYRREENSLMYERTRAQTGPEIYARLSDWQAATGQDLHSLTHDPLMVNPDAGDFHLRSATGRFLENGALTNDLVYSPLLDVGDPASVWTNEMLPNGGRINIGYNGNTPWASLSQTNPWLLALTYNDGGTIRGTVTVYWASGNMSGMTVRLEQALDGVDFTPFASNLPVGVGSYVWNVSSYPASPLARWRVVCETCSAQDQNDSPVYIRNNPLTIYVNDDSTNGDVYVSGIGSPTNTGLSVDSPLHDPDWALQKFILGPDDIMYIDTGIYYLTNSAGMQLGLVGAVLEQGLSNFPIRIQGSTNVAVGGTQVIGLTGTNACAMQVIDSRFVELANLHLLNSGAGLKVSRSTDVALDSLEVSGNQYNGVSIQVSAVVYAHRLLARNNSSYGIGLESDSLLTLNHGVVWDNGLGGVFLSSSRLSATNSVFQSSGANTYAIKGVGAAISSGGDYNFFWVTNGAQIARDEARQLTAKNLAAWHNIARSDSNSAVLNPVFNNPSGGDFYLRSQAGRFVPSVGLFTNDAETSWAIDAGNPIESAGFESAPNGSRVNIGLFGGSPSASRSVTNPALRALRVVSFDDGGQMTTSQPLLWYAKGYSSNQTIRLEFSPNNGLSWIVIATNVPAASGSYMWSPQPTNSSPEVLWRIIDEEDPSRASTNQQSFALRLEPIVFYVNDGLQTGDIYAVEIGNPTNNALTPSSPLDSISAVIDRYDLEPFDQILVDTGYYVLTNAIHLRSDDGGRNSNYVYITGSTNWLAGGTRLDRQSGNLGSSSVSDEAFDIFDSSYFDISYLTVLNANVGLILQQARFCTVTNVIIQNGGRAGIETAGGGPNTFRRLLIARMMGAGFSSTDNSILDSCVIWSNGGSALLVGAGSLKITNSVLHATGSNYCYRLGETASIQANFNDLFIQGLARPSIVASLELEGLPQWTAYSGQDSRSLSVDPLFADPANMDFHPYSPAGRFDPALGAYVTTDVVYSYLVDTGATNYPYTSEPPPNGGRRNIGLYGDTTEASKGRTNQWLLALTGSSGGRMSGLINLTWAWGLMDPTNRVNLEFSYDDGTNWLQIATNQLVSAGEYLWDTSSEPFAITPIARWRLSKVGDTNISDVTDYPFALNGPFSFFVNDSDTNCDVFTTAVGMDSNLGIYPSIPKATLRDVVDTWDLDGGDSVYIDTGYYGMSTNELISIGDSDSGLPGAFVRIVGNTNCSGVQLVWNEPDTVSYLLRLQGSHFYVNGLKFERAGIDVGGTNVVVTGIVLSNGVANFSGANTIVSNLTAIGGLVRSAGQGQSLTRLTVRGGFIELNGSYATLQNSLAFGTQTISATIGGTNIALYNNTFVSRQTAVVVDGGDASLLMRNNTIVADGASGEALAIRLNSGAIDSDYNNLVARNGAWIGNINGYWERLLYWQRASGQDANSISVDPAFADEVNGDFHPKSLAGHWTTSGFVTDTVHAMTIDMGSPTFPYDRESSYHGGRINIGAYGNTPEASRSRATPWLFAITMNDGGVLKGTNVIKWSSGNLTNGATVTIRYSADGGLTWTNVATGVSASAGQYEWDTTQVTSSLRALWDVVLENDTNVLDQVDTLFAVRNTPLIFYVNDGVTNGDVYTHQFGITTNDGLSAETPMRWIGDVLSVYDTEGGDAVYVDTGVYSLTQNVRVIWSRGGDPTNGPLSIVGSTNFVAGGSVLSRGTFAGNAYALDVKASHVRIGNLTIRNAAAAILLDSNEYSVVERLNLVSNQLGILAQKTFRPVIRNNLFRQNVTGGVSLVQSVSNVVENNTFFDNARYAIRLDNSAPNDLQNNIITLSTTGSAAYAGVLDQAFVDYNVYYFTTNGVGIVGLQTNLLQWQLQTARDYRSAITNPLFANASSGDFHLQSALGRWVDGFGFTTDVQSAWAIDRGSTNSLYDLEPLPNGARINIGAYGNTEYASKGLVNTQTLVETRILNQSTLINETNATWPLIWSTINVPTTELFRVEFSGDGGATWYVLTNSVPAYQEYIVWSASPFFNTYHGLWRVVGVNDTNYWDVNDAQFQLFFGTFRINQVFYDGSTNGVVFRGAWAEHYQVQWATNVAGSNYVWWNAFDGTGAQEKASFLSTNGGDFIYRDIQSVTNRFRVYRVMRQEMEP